MLIEQIIQDREIEHIVHDRKIELVRRVRSKVFPFISRYKQRISLTYLCQWLGILPVFCTERSGEAQEDEKNPWWQHQHFQHQPE